MQHPEGPKPDAATLTIGEIAARVSGLARDPMALTERCRHWAKLGFLVAIDREGLGTGKHRLYGADSAYDAAVLIALADPGLHPGEQRWLADAVSVARHALKKWKPARRKGRTLPIFLDVLFIPPGKTMIGIRDGTGKTDELSRLKRERPDVFTRDSFAALTITIDLGRLFEKVWTAASSGAHT